MPAAVAGVMGGPSQEEAEQILRDKFNYTDAEIRRLKQAKTAGWSSDVGTMSVVFVEGRKPVPFNQDVTQEIYQAFIPVVGDDGRKHAAPLKVTNTQSSGPLTYPQEKAGWKRETLVDIQYPADYDDPESESSKRGALKALVDIGRKFGFTVELVDPNYKPKTRK